MKTLWIALLAVGFAACNSGTTTSNTAGSAGESASQATKPAARAAGELVNSALQKATDPEVQGCLSKVKSGAYKEALPLCLKAANIAPDNQQVSDALATAKRKAAVNVGQADEAKKQLNALGDAAKGVKLP